MTSAFVFRFYSEWTLLIGYIMFSILIVGSFVIADASGFRVRRYNIIDNVIKRKIKVLKERGLLIIVSFQIVEYGIPLLLIFTCFIPRAIPAFVSIISAMLIVLHCCHLVFEKKLASRSIDSDVVYPCSRDCIFKYNRYENTGKSLLY